MRRAFLYLLLCCIILLPALCLQAQTIRYQGNIKGGFTLTGNAFRHNLVATDFLNTEGSIGLSKSSTADLILPPGSTIIKAMLYVEGMSSTPITHIKFKVPGSSFIDYMPGVPGFISNPSGASSYQQFIVDVTDIIPRDGYVTTMTAGGDPSGAGRYAVADFEPVLSGNFGYGWALFVVYTNPASEYRSVTLADNCTYLSMNQPVSLTISDVVVPLSGPVKAVVGLTGSYGDYGPGWEDNITMAGAGSPPVYLSDPFTGSATDILNSSIAFTGGNNVSADGGPLMNGNFRARNPYIFTCPNDPAIPNWSSFYFDADILDASNILPNSNVPIDVKLTQTLTSTDAIGSGAYAIAVDVAAAVLTKAINPQAILPGAATTCTFTIANNQPGAINLNNIGFTDNLPSGLIIANPASVVVNDTTATVTAVPGTDIITVSGISLAAGQTATISVGLTNVPGQLNLSCDANPAAFTNGFKNISGVAPNLVNNVSDQCLVINPTPAPVTQPLTYCQFAIAAPLSATGINLTWYGSAGGPGSGVAPVPSTAVPGATTWYVSQTINGIESPLAPLTVTVTEPDIPVFDSMFACRGSLPQPLPLTSLNGITGTWSPDVINTNATSTYTFTPAAGLCALAVTMPVIIKTAAGLPWVLDAATTFSDDIICMGDTVWFNNLSRVKYPPASCVWYFGDGSSAGGTAAAYNYMQPGTYKVVFVITDSLSCRDTAYHTIEVDSLPLLDISLDRHSLCTGESVSCTARYSRQGNTALNWDFGDYILGNDLNPALHAYDHSGLRTIKATAKYRACKALTREDTVRVFAFPNVYIGPDTGICPNSAPIILTNRTERQTGERYLWNTGDTTDILKVSREGVYSLVTENENGCRTRDEIVVHRQCYVDIPNSFTPNGDGINDYFFPRQLPASGITAFSMTVFNRWGSIIFRTEHTESSGWDGRFNRQEQPVGVYPYMVKATFENGQTEQYTGNVTLLR